MNASPHASAGFTVAPARAIIRVAPLAAVLAACLVGGVAAADESTRSVTVRYADLNLASDAGAQKLLSRLSAAARQVCDDHGTRELARVVRADACFRETLSSAVIALHDERLSSMYRARTGPGAT
jgi:UrcA family protein